MQKNTLIVLQPDLIVSLYNITSINGLALNDDDVNGPSFLMGWSVNTCGPCHKKTCLWDFWQSKIQTNVLDQLKEIS